jgi:hypothetical protein
MILLNFSHPLTDAHLARIAELTGKPMDRVFDVRTHFDPAVSFPEQAKALIDQLPLSSQEWQSASLLVNPPSLSAIACLVLAELHGRMGYFPPILRLRAVLDSTPPAFEVAEIISLHKVREQARGQR